MEAYRRRPLSQEGVQQTLAELPQLASPPDEDEQTRQTAGEPGRRVSLLSVDEEPASQEPAGPLTSKIMMPDCYSSLAKAWAGWVSLRAGKLDDIFASDSDDDAQQGHASEAEDEDEIDEFEALFRTGKRRKKKGHAQEVAPHAQLLF